MSYGSICSKAIDPVSFVCKSEEFLHVRDLIQCRARAEDDELETCTSKADVETPPIPD